MLGLSIVISASSGGVVVSALADQDEIKNVVVRINGLDDVTLDVQTACRLSLALTGLLSHAGEKGVGGPHQSELTETLEQGTPVSGRHEETPGLINSCKGEGCPNYNVHAPDYCKRCVALQLDQDGEGD